MVDCDVHPHIPSLDVLSPYLDEAWQGRTGIGKFASPIMKDRNIPAEQFEVPKTRYQNSYGVLRKDVFVVCPVSELKPDNEIGQDRWNQYRFI
jgi:hypothetical protein